VWVLSARLRSHEAAILDAVTQADLTAVLGRMGREAKALALGDWGDVELKRGVRLGEFFRSAMRKGSAATLLAGLALLLPYLPAVDGNSAGTSGIQAALFTAAVASLLAFDSREANADSKPDIRQRSAESSEVKVGL
jgi:hypothetical protein